ncbi:hypothetical protein [Candidatus Poriferisocius sp.]|uniref:hypothetical protein n=1 Tax=Candidatus Poriferisocius sp. TaxID=3101276 RepID=UPI003B02758F
MPPEQPVLAPDLSELAAAVQFPDLSELAAAVQFPDLSELAAAVQFPDLSELAAAVQFPDLSELAAAVQFPDLSELAAAVQFPDLSELAAAVQFPDLSELAAAVQFPDLSELAAAVQFPDLSELAAAGRAVQKFNRASLRGASRESSTKNVSNAFEFSDVRPPKIANPSGPCPEAVTSPSISLLLLLSTLPLQTDQAPAVAHSVLTAFISSLRHMGTFVDSDPALSGSMVLLTILGTAVMLLQYYLRP